MANTIDLIYLQVIDWNSKRYDRVYDTVLLCELLQEELDEYWESSDIVKQADALCDIMYVALGGIWKLESDIEDIEVVFELTAEHTAGAVNYLGIPPACLITSMIDAISKKTDANDLWKLQTIIQCCLYQFQSLGHDFQTAVDCLKAVADSNDTKSIKKTDSNKKANDGDKGNYYVSPVAQLSKILGVKNVNSH